MDVNTLTGGTYMESLGESHVLAPDPRYKPALLSTLENLAQVSYGLHGSGLGDTHLTLPSIAQVKDGGETVPVLPRPSFGGRSLTPHASCWE